MAVSLLVGAATGGVDSVEGAFEALWPRVEAAAWLARTRTSRV